jgi:glyoxylase-like metal-dependent hydrolase (beta-lactamase superfamily II)
LKSVALGPDVFHLQSGSNIGLVVHDGQALLVDTGLDGDAGRRALRVIEERNARLVAIVVTHAHADHFGGARFLQRRLGVPLYAPELEAAMMEHPIIEPLYLFGGAAPIEELRQKFTLAEPCEVEQTIAPGPQRIGPFQVDVIPLPGHALNQVGVAVEGFEQDVLFCADAIFPQETIEKHKVLFCVDLDRTLQTIEELSDQPYDCFAPGHGPTYRRGTAIEAICRANRNRLEKVRQVVHGALDAPRETSAVVQHVAKHFALRITRATAYYLTRTTVLSALTSLERAGEATAMTSDNVVMWKRR